MYKIFLYVLIVALVSCNDSIKTNQKSSVPYNVIFDIKIHEDNFLSTLFGESPQIAIWVENKKNKNLKNIYVTYRAGNNDWKGKVYCYVALPYWSNRLNSMNIETQLLKHDIEAISAPTSKTNIVKTGTFLEDDSIWEYFIEVNLSGDYNEIFKPYLKTGAPDTEGNGQPSIIYSGEINMLDKSYTKPKIIGRTHQSIIVDSLITDLSGITTAKNIFENIEIMVK